MKLICIMYKVPDERPEKESSTMEGDAPEMPVAVPTTVPVGEKSVAVNDVGLGVPDKAASFTETEPPVTGPPS